MTCASAAVLDVLILQLQSALYFCEFGFMNMTLFVFVSVCVTLLCEMVWSFCTTFRSLGCMVLCLDSSFISYIARDCFYSFVRQNLSTCCSIDC